MCEPASLAIAGLAVTAASTGASMFANYQQQKAENKALEYNAKIMERNAENTRLQAAHAVEQGKVEEASHRKKVAAFMGSQRAAAAANGVLVDSGSPLQATVDTAGAAELDALTIRSNAARQAWAYENQAIDYNSSASLTRMKKGSPMMAAGTSLLAGASQLSSGLYNYRDVFK